MSIPVYRRPAPEALTIGMTRANAAGEPLRPGIEHVAFDPGRAGITDEAGGVLKVAMTDGNTPAGRITVKMQSPLIAKYVAADLTGYADGDAVSAWPDSSGNGYDMAIESGYSDGEYVASGLNGQPAVRSNNGDDVQFLVESLPDADQITVFLVGQIDAGALPIGYQGIDLYFGDYSSSEYFTIDLSWPDTGYDTKYDHVDITRRSDTGYVYAHYWGCEGGSSLDEAIIAGSMATAEDHQIARVNGAGSFSGCSPYSEFYEAARQGRLSTRSASTRARCPCHSSRLSRQNLQPHTASPCHKRRHPWP